MPNVIAIEAGHVHDWRCVNERHEEIALALPTELDSLPRLKGFRLRGMEMTRLETFIDAALPSPSPCW